MNSSDLEIRESTQTCATESSNDLDPGSTLKRAQKSVKKAASYVMNLLQSQKVEHEPQKEKASIQTYRNAPQHKYSEKAEAPPKYREIMKIWENVKKNHPRSPEFEQYIKAALRQKGYTFTFIGIGEAGQLISIADPSDPDTSFVFPTTKISSLLQTALPEFRSYFDITFPNIQAIIKDPWQIKIGKPAIIYNGYASPSITPGHIGCNWPDIKMTSTRLPQDLLFFGESRLHKQKFSFKLKRNLKLWLALSSQEDSKDVSIECTRDGDILVYCGGTIKFKNPQGKITIGRTEESDIKIENSDISRKHCTLYFKTKESGTIVLVKDHSRHGTEVCFNQLRFSRRQLRFSRR